MIIEPLLDYLEEQEIGEVGTDLFIGRLPAEIDSCTALIYSPSPEPNKSLDVYEQTVDIWTRDISASDAYSRMLDIQALLHRQGNYQIEGFHIYFSNSLGGIEDLDRDTEKRQLYKLSMRFIYRPDILSS
jgi:hypothetical protein